MIEVNELTKVYREGRGIRNISFQVDPGTAFGFLGPNGAGKTTTIRLLMGFLKPDSGRVTINEYDCWREKTEVKRFVSYLPGELHFIENLTGVEFLDLIAGMHGEYCLPIKKYREYFVSALDLDLKILIRKMSKGMKQKLGIISALMLDASVLIFDEPTSGLDPLMQKVFIDLILEEKKKGKTLFMSSHQFSEIERTCEQAGIIREGNLLAVQSISLLRQAEYQTFEVEVESEKNVELLRQSQLNITPIQGGCFVIRVVGELDNLWLALAQVRVKRFRQRSLELEEAFMDFYR
ncbi:ABC transporter ATP-binding protein [Desulfosporosinus sp. BICA1-9]|uniref:ABC transporter ATP-binding protein n=1 Tax=Desulfosporosinus sp. BICA1-9 TaxID=1531958 RepID=UPI00054B5E01|nr:ABC transporter ATP-binding protein [Desulfosporosinus sp. BICA1-9]KJS48480.1 MAG: ABC transporter ATP-binding protein [Peptococcaceae bacterium BRH_c23]KJS90051.1 MAG: ABC transporter ATP-binding protein [Desulfosporosinus sp. BICA1-9]HBW37593.1 ABC transporter ATP-binding protein [Desulfosporosinus sp.]